MRTKNCFMGGRSLSLEKRNHKICCIFQEDDGKKHAFNIVSRKLLSVFTESRVMSSTLVRSTWSFFFRLYTKQHRFPSFSESSSSEPVIARSQIPLLGRSIRIFFSEISQCSSEKEDILTKTNQKQKSIYIVRGISE